MVFTRFLARISANPGLSVIVRQFNIPRVIALPGRTRRKLLERLQHAALLWFLNGVAFDFFLPR